MSWIEQAREDLADAIEALPALDGVAVLREWVPELNREDLESREVHIAPQARRTRLAGRSCRIESVDVSVAIIDPLDAETEAAQVTSGHDLADAIIDAILGKRIGGVKNMICLEAEQSVTTSVEHWRDYRMFASFLTIKLES